MFDNLQQRTSSSKLVIMQYQSRMRFQFSIVIGLLLTACAGCTPVATDPQEAAWNRVAKEDEAYLSQHQSVVNKVHEHGGEVSAFREVEKKAVRFSLYIKFPDPVRIDDSTLKGLLDGSPVKLLLGQTSVTDEGLSELRNNLGIEALDLTGTNVSDHGLDHIATLTSLRVLGLGKTRITDRGMSALNALTSLESLRVYENEITDEGVAHLGPLHALRSINLANTAVTDAALEHFASMKSLKDVRLSGTQVTSEGVAILQRQLPDYKVHMER